MKNLNLEFHVTKENLNGTQEIKTMKLENDCYIVFVYYYGDYATEKANHTLDKNNFSAKCKSKKANLTLDIYPVSDIQILIRLTELGDLFITEVDPVIDLLKVAKQSAINLETILNKYFEFKDNKKN